MEPPPRPSIAGGRILHQHVSIQVTHNFRRACHDQDWRLLKVFDSKVELSESEEENEFNYSNAVALDGAGTAGMMRLG